MNETLHTVDLPPGRAITLPATPDQALLVLRGRIWLTRSGDPDDHFLDTGQRIDLGEGGERVVVEAVNGPAQCCLVPGSSLVIDEPMPA
ncbi:DUF2917 domain-containing protein [Aquincola sp. S2]|uniref:DUF2917 domain-containing protein n=1 Tax=Pseudaquabacterium terrae TaxID=2732868 RepID=A0ABX2EKA2_9BURK|nr:DUF2917 domain-containing protein [Aquabacterium terrae]NRF69010.1 DUF2917 domain-containing protein [Aquabacterium terrae]